VSWRSWMAFAALGVMWGVPYYLIKLAVQELSPWVIAWGRVSLAACILLPIAWRRGALSSLGRHKLALLAFGLVEFVIPMSVIARPGGPALRACWPPRSAMPSAP
jgi:drug/metabolite transporter (DMT)-like permease